MSKYTVSKLESTDQLNDNDLLMVSTAEADGTYSSRNITFGALAQQVGEGGSGGDSTGNQETDIINFFTPKSTFMVVDSRFIKGSDASIILINEDSLANIKICTVKTSFTYYDKQSHVETEVPVGMPITALPNDIKHESYKPEGSEITYEYIRDSQNFIQYDNTILANWDTLTETTLPIKSKLELKHFSADNFTFYALGYNGSTGVYESHTFYVLKIITKPTTLAQVKFGTGSYQYKNFSKLNITIAKLKSLYDAGYKYMLIGNNASSSTTDTTHLLNWNQTTQLDKMIDFPANSHIILLPQKSDDTTTYASNSVVYTEEVTIKEPCAVYVQASFTCQKSSSIGQSYYIELQIKATANGDENWYPIFRKFADVDQNGRTSVNYQLFARAGVKIRGIIYPQGNAGNIYYNLSNFTFTLCKTSGQFQKKEESVQILNVEFKKTNSNFQAITNTDEDSAANPPIVGRWITLNGNFSTYGGFRRSKIDTTANMYMLLRRIKTNIIPDEDSGDDPSYEDDSSEETIDYAEDDSTVYLESPAHTSTAITSYDSSKIAISNYKIPFHTVVLNNKNNNYSTYEYFVPAVLNVSNNGSTIDKYEYSLQLMSARCLGNNSSFMSYGPNSAIINKTTTTEVPNIPTAANARTKFVFYPKRSKLQYSFNHSTYRDSVIGLYNIQQTTKANTKNLAELELFIERSDNKYDYANVYENMDGASQLYFCAVHPTATVKKYYTAYQANIVLNDVITAFSVSSKTTKYALNIGKRLRIVAAIADSVESFNDYCFYECTNLRQLPNTELKIKTLGNHCFYACKKLGRTLKLNQVINVSGTNTFNGCTSLQGLQMTEFAGEVPTKFAYKCSSLTTVYMNKATIIGEDAFNGAGITAIVANNKDGSRFGSATTLNKNAFANCKSLTSVELPSCTSIGENAFSKCTSLMSLSLSAGSKSIGKNAFSGCPLTQAINLGEVSSIGSGAFSSANKMDAVFQISNTEDLPALKSINAFPNNAAKNTWKIKIPNDDVRAKVESHKVWRQLKNRVIA